MKERVRPTHLCVCFEAKAFFLNHDSSVFRNPEDQAKRAIDDGPVKPRVLGKECSCIEIGDDLSVSVKELASNIGVGMGFLAQSVVFELIKMVRIDMSDLFGGDKHG